VNTVKESKCSELVQGKMLTREAEIKALMSDPNSDWYDDDPALSIETEKVTTICLSYGGPADYLEVTHNDNGIRKVIYRYSDWFDTATIEVEEGSAFYQYAEFTLEIMEA
jgi:hypothetical protein